MRVCPGAQPKAGYEIVISAGSLATVGDEARRAIKLAHMHDKKSVSGHLKWVLPERLGRARIVDGSQISPRLLRASLHTVLRRALTVKIKRGKFDGSIVRHTPFF